MVIKTPEDYNMKKFEDYTYSELIDDLAGIILTELIAGRFRSGVVSTVNAAFNWHDAQTKKKTK